MFTARHLEECERCAVQVNCEHNKGGKSLTYCNDFDCKRSWTRQVGTANHAHDLYTVADWPIGCNTYVYVIKLLSIIYLLLL